MNTSTQLGVVCNWQMTISPGQSLRGKHECSSRCPAYLHKTRRVQAVWHRCAVVLLLSVALGWLFDEDRWKCLESGVGSSQLIPGCLISQSSCQECSTPVALQDLGTKSISQLPAADVCRQHPGAARVQCAQELELWMGLSPGTVKHMTALHQTCSEPSRH